MEHTGGSSIDIQYNVLVFILIVFTEDWIFFSTICQINGEFLLLGDFSFAKKTNRRKNYSVFSKHNQDKK